MASVQCAGQTQQHIKHGASIYSAILLLWSFKSLKVEWNGYLHILGSHGIQVKNFIYIVY